MLVLKVVFYLPGSFSKAGMFCVANSWLPKEQSPSLIFNLLAFCFCGNLLHVKEAIPPKPRGFRSPK